MLVQSSALLHRADRLGGGFRDDLWLLFTQRFRKKPHSEVAAVLKLSRSRFAKTDISASVRVSAQKALPNCYPHCLVFQLLFSLCLLESGVWEGVGLMVGGGGGAT